MLPNRQNLQGRKERESGEQLLVLPNRQNLQGRKERESGEQLLVLPNRQNLQGRKERESGEQLLVLPKRQNLQGRKERESGEQLLVLPNRQCKIMRGRKERESVGVAESSVFNAGSQRKCWRCRIVSVYVTPVLTIGASGGGGGGGGGVVVVVVVALNGCAQLRTRHHTSRPVCSTDIDHVVTERWRRYTKDSDRHIYVSYTHAVIRLSHADRAAVDSTAKLLNADQLEVT